MALTAEQKKISRARGYVRKSITELEKEVENIATTSTEEQPAGIDFKIKQWAAKAKSLSVELKEYDEKYQATFSEETEESIASTEYDVCRSYKDKLATIELRLDSFGKSVNPSSAPSTENSLAEVLTSLAELQKQMLTDRANSRGTTSESNASGGELAAVLERVVSLQEANASGAAQLPTARLRRFDGNQQDFLVFLDEFRRFVHEKSTFSDLQKHKVLRDVLAGDAAKAVLGIPLTGESYNKTLRYLIKRYGCVETMVFGVFTRMLELQKVYKAIDIVALRSLLDQVNNYVILLDSLKLDKKYYSCIMYPVFLRAIPDSLAFKFLSNFNDNDVSSEDEIRNDAEVSPNVDEVDLKIVANENLSEVFAARFVDVLAFLEKEISTREKQQALCGRIQKTTGGPSSGSGRRSSQHNAVSSNSYYGTAQSGNEDKGTRSQQSSQQRRYDSATDYQLAHVKYNKTYGSAHDGARGNKSASSNQGNNSAQVLAARGSNDGASTSNSHQQAVKSVVACLFCQGNHGTATCRASMTVLEKRQALAVNRGCWKCLETSHKVVNCKAPPCKSCGGHHHLLLCQKAGSSVSNSGVDEKGLMPTGHVRVQSVNNNSRVVRFLLDSGSQRGFITERLAKELGLRPLKREWVYLHVLGGATPAKPQSLQVVKLTMLTQDGEPVEVKARIIPEITTAIIPAPSSKIRRGLSGYNLAEKIDGPTEIELLLSSADSFRVMVGGWQPVGQSFLVVGTRFGHVVISDPDTRGKTTLTASAAAPDLTRFWSLESLGVDPAELVEENNTVDVVNKFKLGIELLPEGRYQVKMNLKPNVAMLESNFGMALKQFKSLATRLRKNDKLREDYVREMKMFIDEGFAEVLPTGEKPAFVMAHFPVVQPDKESYKVRPVFNASAAARGKLSLNDCIADTPNLLPCPLKALINFRRYEVAFSADISKAYLMVKVHPDHRNFLCFLWFEDDQNFTGQKLYRMSATAFGVKDSQFNTISVIHHHVQKFIHDLPEASSRLLNDLYMDDLLTGADSIAEASKIWQDITEILAAAGMVLKKFKSSDETLRHQFSSEFTEDGVLLKPKGLSKVLGVGWNQVEDQFTFSAQAMVTFTKSATPCMRTLMGACARLYDPQGLLAPFTMVLKLILQEAHLAKLRLDDTLPAPLLTRWLRWAEELQYIEDFKVNRSLELTGALNIELHAFADASDRAYAAVVYVKTITERSGVTVSLVASKAKLAPLKQLDQLTIPKKELMAAMLATRLAKKVKECLKLYDCATFYWTDSQVVLHWIRAECPAKWGVFVRNRLVEILATTTPTEWSFCPGQKNPADLPSRGMMMAKLNKTKLWLSAADFVQGPRDLYPTFNEDPAVATTVENAGALFCTTNSPLVDPSRFSSMMRLMRVEAYVHRALERFRRTLAWVRAGRPASWVIRTHRLSAWPAHSLPCDRLAASELEAARTRLLRQAQNRVLGESWALLARGDRLLDPKIAAFGPFMDENGLIRIGGRLQLSEEEFKVKHPILLGDDPLTRLIIKDAHEGRVMHMKTEAVINELRETYWIMRMRRVVKSVVHKCTACARDRARFATATEAPLPAGRVEMSFRPFKTVGLDYMGPFVIKTKSGEEKRWVALFTCATVRAVHLEVVEDLSGNECLSALRRFAALRGLPEIIVTDNALAYRKVSRCLAALFKACNSEALQNFFGQTGIRWDFNVPKAPWWGGFFERMIGLTKTCLRKVLKTQKVAPTHLTTILHEIAAVINQRPITNVPSEPGEPRALTPAHFLTPAVPLVFPEGNMVSLGGNPDQLVKVWRQRETILTSFWKRWRSEYMLMLRSVLRRTEGRSEALEVGDIVIEQQDDAPRAYWKLGRIEEVLKSGDGVPRAYRVHLGEGKFVNRPGRLLAKLL